MSRSAPTDGFWRWQETRPLSRCARAGQFLGVVRMDWLVPGSFPGIGLALSQDGALLALSTFALGGQVIVLSTGSIIAADSTMLDERDAARQGADADEEAPILTEMARMLGVVHRFGLDAWAIEFSPDGSALARTAVG